MSLSKLIKAKQSPLLVTPLHEEALSRRKGGDVELTVGVAEFVKTQLMAKQRDRTGAWSASSLGFCQRQQVYAFLGTEEERYPSSQTNAVFRQGTWIHLKWQADGFMEGWLVAAEVPMKYEPLNLRGTMDGLLTTGEGLEIKSTNSRSFRFIMENGPDPKHLKQVHAYMLGLSLDTFSIIYESKDTQDWKEFVVPYAPATAQDVEDELRALQQAIDTKRLPRRLSACEERDGIAYRQCPFRERCLAGDGWPHGKHPRRIAVPKRALPAAS